MPRSLTVLALVVLSCGGGKPPCNTATCTGCCDEAGECKSGVGADACGSPGTLCAVCTSGQQCQLGACVAGILFGTGGGASSGSGGGTSASGGGTTSGSGGGTATGSGGGTVTGSGGGTVTGSGGGTVTGSGGGTVTGSGGGTMTGSGGGTMTGTGGSGGGSTTCGASNCAGCCRNNQCLSGDDATACGLFGATCQTCTFACTIGQCFGGGTSAGDGGTGSACSQDSHCKATLFETASCLTESAASGAATGWVQGYCSSTCGTLLSCEGDGVCLNDNYCYKNCSNPNGGRGSCRQGYVCQALFNADGGSVAGQGVCQPDCHNAGFVCATGQTCRSNGNCIK